MLPSAGYVTFTNYGGRRQKFLSKLAATIAPELWLNPVVKEGSDFEPCTFKKLASLSHVWLVVRDCCSRPIEYRKLSRGSDLRGATGAERGYVEDIPGNWITLRNACASVSSQPSRAPLDWVTASGSLYGDGKACNKPSQCLRRTRWLTFCDGAGQPHCMQRSNSRLSLTGSSGVDRYRVPVFECCRVYRIAAGWLQDAPVEAFLSRRNRQHAHTIGYLLPD